MLKQITLRPRLTEKTYAQSENSVYVVNVEKSLNKDMVAKAMKAQFDVEIKSVNMVNVKGKAKRTISLSGKRSANSSGKRSDYKKANVTLKNKQKLPFFDAIEEEENKQTENQKQIDKAAAKNAEKAEKKRSIIPRRKRESK